MSPLAWEGLWPEDRRPVLPCHQEEPGASGGVSVVGGVEHSPFGVVAQRLERHEPRLEVLSLVSLVGPSFGVEGPPFDELGDVLYENSFYVQFRKPVVYDPRIHPALIVDRFPAAGPGVKPALGRRHEQVQPPFLHDGLGVDDAHVLDEVAGGGVVRGVGGDGGVPVVDGHQLPSSRRCRQWPFRRRSMILRRRRTNLLLGT